MSSYGEASRRRSRSPERRHERDGRSQRDDDAGKRSEKRRSRDHDRRRERSRSRSRSRSRDRDREGGKDRDRDSKEHRRRSRSRSRDRGSSSRHHHHRSSRRRSPSSGSSSNSDSDDSRERRRHKKSKHRDDELDSKGRTKEERRKRRQEKKEKKERKLKKKGIAPVEWGKHGIIAATDIYTKDQEFRSWLVEEKMINPETLSKAKEKEHFMTFMEEFNTGTLPHDKYYDIAKYETRMNAVRMGESIEDSSVYDPNKDLEAVRSSHRRKPVETESFLDRSKLEELARVNRERIEMERMKRLGMEVKDSMGVRMDDKI